MYVAGKYKFYTNSEWIIYELESTQRAHHLKLLKSSLVFFAQSHKVLL